MVTPTPLPIPLPVSYGGSDADWWIVWLTGISALTSLLVAISALVSSSRAKQIAQASEVARVKAEGDRVTREYELRLEEALVVLLNGITDHLASLRPFDSPEAPPPADGIVAAIQLVRLRAEGKDREVIADVAELLRVTAQPSVRRRKQYEVLSELVVALREWRTKVRTRDNFRAWLESTAARF